MNGTLPEPDQLRGKLGREEFTQKLLTCLVLGRVERGWNVTRNPSPTGALFLRALHTSAFGDSSVPDEAPGFVDEFELLKRVESEPSGWPDYGVVWPDRLFLIELKTEARSHRPAQIPYYLQLAAHRHPDVATDLLYLTPAMPLYSAETVTPRQRFRHLTWAEVAPLVGSAWSRSDIPAERELAAYLIGLIDEVETSPRMTRPSDPTTVPGSTTLEAADPSLPTSNPEQLERGLALAAATQADGVQRAMETDFADPADLDALRLQLRERLMARPTVDGVRLRNVLPWIWRNASSGGAAMTRLGEDSGYELRLSRYQRDVSAR